MSAGAVEGTSILDDSLGVGYEGTGEDWSHAKSSERKDRPLTNEQLKLLTAKSNAAGLCQLSLQYLEMAGAAALIAASSPIGGAAGIALRLFGTLLVGFGLVTMGHCAQHECIHNTAFASRRLNALVAWMVSLPRLTNPRWERMLHKDHHTYTNDPNRDPEIMAGDPANSMPGDLWAYATKILRIGGGKFGLGVYSTRMAILISGARGHVVGYSGFDPVPAPKAAAVRDSLAASCRAQLALYAAIAAALSLAPGGWSAAFKYWLLPLLVGEPLHAVFHIADHLNTEQDHTNGRGNTRTTTAPRFVAFNLWNMNYHAEHHLYPSIPFHHLPAAHTALSGHFDRISPSAFDLHRQLLTRWMPHFQQRLREKGTQGVQGDGWQPCTPDRA